MVYNLFFWESIAYAYVIKRQKYVSCYCDAKFVINVLVESCTFNPIFA